MKRPPPANDELAIINLLWPQDRMTAREIREELYPDDTKAQQGTVQGIFQRLEDKGYVNGDSSLSIHFFSAAPERNAYEGERGLIKTKKLQAMNQILYSIFECVYRR